MKKTHFPHCANYAFTKPLLTGAFSLLLLLACHLLPAQSIQGKIFYADSRQETIELDWQYFEKYNGLKVAGTGRDIPIGSLEKLEANGMSFFPRRVELYDIEQGREKDDLRYSKTDTLLLLQKLISGTISFYNHVDAREKEHFFVEKDTVIKPLVQIEYRKGFKAGTLDWYKGTLRVLMNDCSNPSQEKLENLKFIRSNIEKLIIQYNKSCGQLDYVESREKLRIRFGPQIGMAYFRSSFGSPADVEYFEKFSGIGQFDDMPFVFGGFAEIPVLRRLRKAFIQLHFQVSSPLQLDYSWENRKPFRNDTLIYTGLFEGNYYEVGLSFQKGLNIDNSALSPFFGLGIGMRNWFNVKNAETYISALRPAWYEVTEQKAVPEDQIPQNIAFLQIMAGANYKKLQLGIAFQLPEAGITAHSLENNYSLALFVNYRLN